MPLLLLTAAGCSQATALRIHIDTAVEPTQLQITVSLDGGHAPLSRSLMNSATSQRLPGTVIVLLPDYSAVVQIALDGTGVGGAPLHASAKVVSSPHSIVDVSLQLSSSSDGGPDLSPAPGADLTPAPITDLAPAYDLTSPDGGVLSGWYMLMNVHGLCVDTVNGASSSGTQIDQQTCTPNQYSQQWQFMPTDSGYFYLLNRGSGLVVDVTGGDTSNSVPLELWTYLGGYNQQFMPQPLGLGQYSFVIRSSSRCIDVPGASSTPGKILQQWDCNQSNAQLFYLLPQP